ncbi:UDP-2,3-diacylglucosamine hydrolase [uncultured Thiomicrorhabdus sp.]
MSTLVIADIHLQPNQPNHPINIAFKRFLKEKALNAKTLIILGDLFEVWLGDDISLALFESEIAALRQLSEQNVEILLQYGNRDFLMRKSFCKASGAKLLPEEYEIQVADQNIIMVHGDQLCTADQQYQKMRRWFRNPIIQWIFLHLPKSKRLSIGNKMRNESKQAGSHKSGQLMDVTKEGIAALVQRHPSANILVHGHTHKPTHEQLQVNGKNIQRYVLSDWRPQTSYLSINDNHIQVLDFA